MVFWVVSSHSGFRCGKMRKALKVVVEQIGKHISVAHKKVKSGILPI